MRFLRQRKTRRLLLAAVPLLVALVAWRALSGGAEPYVPGAPVEGLVDSLGRELPADYPRVRFEEVAAAAGLRFEHFPGERAGRLPEDMGSGVALGDVDGDGWTDVFLVNAAPMAGPGEGARSRLFRNRGDGGFEDVTAASGIDVSALGMAAALCDVDGDGDLDLFVTTYGACRLWENDGAGHFTDVSGPSGLAAHEGFWTGIAVGDYDVDGAIDLYVCGYVRFDESLGGTAPMSQYGVDIPVLLNPSVFEPERNLLLKGRGDGTFEEVAADLGVDNPTGRSLGAVLCDLTGDGRPDLYVANDVSDNAFFVNRGDGTFVDRTTDALVGDYRGAMGLAVADFDRDLDLDLFITHWVAQENALYVCYPRAGDEPAEGSADLPRFMDGADRVGLGHVGLRLVGWATGFLDYDNDGRLDLFVVNGSTIPLAADPAHLEPMPTQLFWNGGERAGYYEVGSVAGAFFAGPVVGRGGATFDYDLDGDEDLVIVAHGAPVALLRNDGGNRNGSLLLRLREPRGNRFALGARVVVTSGGARQLDVVGTQGSYLSQHAVGELAFGLGGARDVELIEVTWPDGEREAAGPFPAGSLVTWVRGSAPRTEPLPGRLALERRGPQEVAELQRFYADRQAAGAARLAGEHARAVELYRAALARWPGHADCLYYLGNSLVALGRERQALATFERLVAYVPESNRGWMQIGRLRLPGGDSALDDLERAEHAFRRSHEINGEETGPVVQLGVCALLRDDLDEAARRFAQAAHANHRSIEARWLGGRVAWLQGNRARARELLAEAHALATGRAGGSASASSEGETRRGGALTDAAEVPLDAALTRWRTLAERPIDADAEYGGGH